MKSFQYQITDDTGIHARPAGLLVKLASTYKSDISIILDGKKANGKSILNVITLGAIKGSNLLVQAEGEDEDKAALELEAFFKETL